ncbi:MULTISPECIES: citrulline utilization hydrolase CtlX [unclassified Colwellia]|uniref:citrulline utilization hydrolase CtlX n=1 Tax=unclassified Colwellia TaxID=196834 RepID=UPI0015F3DF56|nr:MULTISPECIES: arginine deiminase-related protein [unclassified Colwellia]MBA6353172.1 amidinotransferase [Colwellia sp. BRX9-1]MBA6354908.1 amidinotransferase [Colwellia sp. BRX8-3]MBA6360303.1 amidinotransferase [Colwellia sp. BRX8-6]MBA6367673.1 amidinotransferase [Colwellia sp. BRX8-5]MBA6374189.1 amidinotransferase [Colwellia sp. BRX8-2]
MPVFPQAPNAVVMIRPHHFFPNEETKQDNSFQSTELVNQDQIKALAFDQVTSAATILAAEGVVVHLFEDEGLETPDSVFPNNWFSTHSGGQVAIYPMYARNRRKERRTDIIAMLKQQYRVQVVFDYSGLEYDDIYLEGTGAMVLDHIERIAYAVSSKRTDSHVLERFCAHFNFEPMVFDAQDKKGTRVYHTNVLMCIGSDFVMAGFEMMTNPKRRDEIIKRFENAGKKIIYLTEQQINQFCGNALELQGTSGRILALSLTAYNALTPQQITLLEETVKLVPLNVSAIEMAGGSVRCMLAGVHLSKR